MALRRRHIVRAPAVLVLSFFALFASGIGVVRSEDLKAQAEAGDAAAQFRLATMYDLGAGEAQNTPLAFDWYRRAAESGLAEAEFNVAVMLDSGRGTAQDNIEAATWYARAAAQGNYRAQYNLALMYDTGNGVPHNAGFAAFWLRKATIGVPIAVSRLKTLSPREHADTLSAAVPRSPRGNIAAGHAPLEFVWTAPEQPESATYVVEIRILSRVSSRELFSEMTEGSVMLAPLRASPGEYAWRISTITRLDAHYVTSEWTKFTISSAHIRR